MRRGGPQGGFTLVEVLVAVAVTAILLLTLYGIVAPLSKARQRLEEEGEGFHQARVLFDRIGREVRGAYFRAPNERTFFAGGTDERGEPFLELTTTAVSGLRGGAGGLAWVRYRLGEDPQGGRGRGVLWRSESPPAETGPPGERVKPHRVARGIREMKLRFYGKGGWHDGWDAREEQGLPLLVELFMELEADGARIPFLSTVEIPLALEGP